MMQPLVFAGLLLRDKRMLLAYTPASGSYAPITFSMGLDGKIVERLPMLIHQQLGIEVRLDMLCLIGEPKVVMGGMVIDALVRINIGTDVVDDLATQIVKKRKRDMPRAIAVSLSDVMNRVMVGDRYVIANSAKQTASLFTSI